MKSRRSLVGLACLAWAATGWLHAQTGNAAAAQLPEAPGKVTVKKVCSGCHPAELVLGRGMSRDQWGDIVSNMISKGAKGSDAEFTQIVDYLAANLPPNSRQRPAQTAGSTPEPVRRKPAGGLLAQAGANDKQIVDDDAADRGKTVYIAQCITCHGTRARGNDHVPDLVRSLVVLQDRYGDKIGPFLKNGHPMQSGAQSASLDANQVLDLSHFLHQKVGDTLRTGPYNKVLNVLTGDAQAGKAYFNGAGGCSGCHSPTGNLAGIASRYEPAALQLKTVFPQTVSFGRRAAPGERKPVTVTVSGPGVPAVSGTLVQMDDFDISLRDDAGQYLSFKRTPELTIQKHDPFAAHVALLDTYTDKEMHDVVAYLETLK